MPSDTRPAFLTPPEIARSLRVSETKVAAWIKSGRLRAFNVSEGQRPKYRIRADDLESFLDGRTAAPPPTRPVRRERRDIPQYV
ncbi:MAG: helix-turn-helix domain-containing protein [Planctomycetaceae bacterium]|nr:helix-turn-helix domain-containing protein [Planctomycetaceae bacterium]